MLQFKKVGYMGYEALEKVDIVKTSQEGIFKIIQKDSEGNSTSGYARIEFIKEAEWFAPTQKDLYDADINAMEFDENLRMKTITIKAENIEEFKKFATREYGDSSHSEKALESLEEEIARQGGSYSLDCVYGSDSEEKDGICFLYVCLISGYDSFIQFNCSFEEAKEIVELLELGKFSLVSKVIV